MQRHQHAIRGGKRIERQDAQRRRAIHEDQIELAGLADRLQGYRQPQQMILRPGELHVRAAQIHFARNQREPVEGRGFDLVGQRSFPKQRAIRARPLDFLHPHAARRIGLRIQVEQEHALARGREARRQIHRRGGFADSTLLVGNRDHFDRHAGD